MKTGRMIFLGTIALIACLFFEAVLAAYPIPNGYVNDFVNVIPQESENVLEKKLSDYEKTTSIEIAVVFPQSLEGRDIESWTMGLAEQWKVGKKGKDNGLIVVIAPNERKWRIEVGRGLEGDMTDLTAGRLGDSVLVPYLKKGDYPGGSSALVDSIIGTLGQYSAEERILSAQKKAEEERIAREKANEFLVILLSIASVFAGIALVVFFIRFIIRKIREGIARRKLIAALKDLTAAKFKKLEALNNFLEVIKKNEEVFPHWAEIEFNALIKEADNSISAINGRLKEAEKMIDSNPEEANNLLHAIDEDGARDFILDANLMPQKIEGIRKEAQSSIEFADKLIAYAVKDVEEIGKLGIETDKSSGRLEEMKKNLGLLQERMKKSGVGKDDFSREIHKDAAVLVNEAKEITTTIISLAEERKRIMDFMERSSELKDGLKDGIAEHAKVLKGVQKNNPESVWREVAGRYAGAENLLGAFAGLVASIGSINLSEESGIIAAHAKMEEAEKNREMIASLQKSIISLDNEIEEAKKKAEGSVSSAETKVSEAGRYVRKSDVGSGAKSKARDAESKLNIARAGMSNQLIDWFAVATALQAAISLAEDAIRKAKSDISSKESALVISSRSKSQISSSPSIGGGGFGGFGGGSFGGGGASGSW